MLVSVLVVDFSLWPEGRGAKKRERNKAMYGPCFAIQADGRIVLLTIHICITDLEDAGLHPPALGLNTTICNIYYPVD